MDTEKSGLTGLTRKEADEIIEGMLDKQNELYSSHSVLLSQSRSFKNLKDNEFEKFLNNDLIDVSATYAMNAARTIQHKETFLLNREQYKKAVAEKIQKGQSPFLSNEEQFTIRFLDPINEDLKRVRKKPLTKADKKSILKLYKSVTGQVDYFDSGLIQGIYDGMKLTNAVAYLPLATVTSLSEATIPLTKAPKSFAVEGMQDAIKSGSKIFWTETKSILKEKYKMPDDKIVKEMNSVMLVVDESFIDFTNRLSGEGLQNEFLKKVARGFYRMNLLVPWTKTIQLASFSTGKDIITDNLNKLSKLKQEGINISAVDAPMKVQRLREELFDLGIDFKEGLEWLAKGSKEEDSFYKQIIKGAGRFTNSVILPTGREAARVPLYMTNPKFDILTQFLRYPTVFSNTILKNYARDVIQNPNVNAPKAVAFAVMATSIARATNYWRASDERRERYDNEDIDWRNTLDAMQRVGLLGPFEYAKRYTEAVSYGQGPLTGLLNLGGPVLNDTVGMLFYDRGLLETAARKRPLIGVKNIFDREIGDIMEEYTGFRETYTPTIEAAKKRDKQFNDFMEQLSRSISGVEERKARLGKGRLGEGRLGKFDGGKVSEDFPVANVKEEPSEMINKATGLPYEAEMERLGFKDGLLVSVGVAPVSEKQMDKLKNKLKERKTMREGGESVIEEIEVTALKKMLPQRGEESYNYAIDMLGEGALDKQALREMAFVESKYAKDEGTFRPENRSAYQITPIRFKEFQKTMNPNNPRGKGLRAYTNNLKNKYNLDLSKIEYDDLNDPVIGTAVTRALLKLNPESIGKTVEERARQWKDFWNTEEGAGTVQKYIDDVSAMK